MRLSRELERRCLELAAPRPIKASAPAARGAGRWALTIMGWHPTPLNRLIGCHPMTAHRRKQHDQAIVQAEALIQGVPSATSKRSVGLRIVLAKGQRACDVDAYWKSLLDALVSCGLLIDDSREWCELGPVEFERGKKATIVELADVTADGPAAGAVTNQTNTIGDR